MTGSGSSECNVEQCGGFHNVGGDGGASPCRLQNGSAAHAVRERVGEVCLSVCLVFFGSVNVATIGGRVVRFTGGGTFFLQFLSLSSLWLFGPWKSQCIPMRMLSVFFLVCIETEDCRCSQVIASLAKMNHPLSKTRNNLFSLHRVTLNSNVWFPPTAEEPVGEEENTRSAVAVD